MKSNKNSVINLMNEEKAISMNMPYVSVQKILEIVNKSIDEYERMYKNGKSSHEKKLGLRGEP